MLLLLEQTSMSVSSNLFVITSVLMVSEITPVSAMKATSSTHSLTVPVRMTP